MGVVVLCHRIALNPTPSQEIIFKQAVGVARFSYNWALAEWKRQYEAGEKPNEAALRRQLNSLKREQFSWMLDVPKSVPQQSIKNCGAAFGRFFKKQSKYPTFKKKGRHDSARFDNGPETIKFKGKSIRMPVVGWVKMREELRFSGKPLSATVSRTADRWFVSVPVQIQIPDPVVRENQIATGIDLGISTAVTLANGEKLEAPKALTVNLRKLRRRSRRHSRKQKGSANRRKSARRLAKFHARIANVRENWTHQITTRIVREYSLIGIEDLNVRGMMANEKLARPISDVGFHEIRRQIEYKASIYNAKVVVVDRWYPSSKICSSCNYKLDELPLGERSWTCPACGTHHDRDNNAAINLRAYALGYRELRGKSRLSDTMLASKELRGRNQAVSYLAMV